MKKFDRHLNETTFLNFHRYMLYTLFELINFAVFECDEIFRVQSKLGQSFGQFLFWLQIKLKKELMTNQKF